MGFQPHVLANMYLREKVRIRARSHGGGEGGLQN